MLKTILAMDLSLNLPAFCIAEVNTETKQFRILEVRHVDNKRNTKMTHAEKLKTIADEIRHICSKYHGSIDVVVRERGFSRFATTTQALFRVVGVSDLTILEGCGISTIEEIAPTAVKMAIAGYGKASKEEVEEGVRERLMDDQKSFEFYSDDEADACGVAMTYAIKKDWIV